MLIGVTGSSGAVGGRVASRLAQSGVHQRLVVRDSSRAPALEGAEIRQASSYGAGEEMRRALEGVYTLFLVPARESHDRVLQHRTAVDSAVAAGVQRIVYLSFLGASPQATFTLARHHWATEEHIRASGLSFTFLRMSLYLDFVPYMVPAEGVIAGPAGNGRLGAVLRDDIADVAAVVLTREGHRGRTYDVTGAEAFTLAEAAEVMSKVSGKRIVYKDETIEEAWASRAKFHAPDFEVEGWITSYLAVAAGELETISDAVARLAGHRPVTLSEYLASHPEALAHVDGG